MEQLKFTGEGQLFQILNQLNLDKTLFIQLLVFVVTFTIAYILFFKKYAEIQFKRSKGTSSARTEIDKLLNRLDSIKEKYHSEIGKVQAASNAQVREATVLAQKDHEKKIVELKSILAKELDNYRKKTEEETKNLIDDSISNVIELKERLVGKILG